MRDLRNKNFKLQTSSLLGVDRDWSECKDRQLWVEIAKAGLVNDVIAAIFDFR